MRNWRELKEGSFAISEELRQHFLKYSDRTIPPLNPTSIKIDLTQEKKMGEYESIIQRCASTDREQSDQSFSDEQIDTSAKEYKPNNDKKRITLDELKEKIQKRLDSGNNIDLNDEIIVKTVESNNRESIPTDLNKEIELYDNTDKKLTTHLKASEEKNDKNIMEYPERIRIPKKAYKKGATYKVNDCYYDHDGKFLYRVLGMSNN